MAMERGIWKLLGSAVVATIIGGFITASIMLYETRHQEFLAKENIEDRKQQREIEKNRHNEQWDRDNLRYAQEKAERESQFIFERLLKLQNLYFNAKSGDELSRLDKTLDWMEKSSKDDTTKELIVSFRKQILKEEFKSQLETKQNNKISEKEKEKIKESLIFLKQLEEREKEKKLRDAAAAAEKAKLDENIEAVALHDTKKLTDESRKLLAISELICIDPQSNWPKNCDQVYLKVNGKRLWDKYRQICRGDRLTLNDKIFFDNQTEIELWEYDRLEDDLLGKFKVIDNLNNSYGRAKISDSRDKGDWNYTIIFNSIR
jgi:hypothetical protein